MARRSGWRRDSLCRRSWRIRCGHNLRLHVEGETQTLPLAINAALNTPGRDDVAFRLALISLAAAITGLVLAEMLQRWARRRLEA